MRAALKKFAGALDGRDGMLVIGLLMMGLGIGMFNAAAGVAVPGTILVGIAIFGTR